MKTVCEIYSEYQIMLALAMHQLRVAAVAKSICDNFQGEIDTKNVVLACLFHDMGNIIKSDLNYFPEFLKPEGLEYWQVVKDKYIEKYGKDEHLATVAIAKEISLSDKTISCIEHIGFTNIKKNENSDSFENKICNYADMRVGPYGVISIEERLAEGKKRYAKRSHVISSDLFEFYAESLRNIEKQIFAKTNIRPEEIDEDRIVGVIKELKNLTI